VAIFAGVVAAGALCLYIILRRSDLHPPVSVTLTLVGALAGSTAWGARPQLLNMLLTGLLVVGLGAYRRGRLSPWLLPPFIWLWANLHSGFLVGVIIASLFAVGEWFDARRSPATGMPAGRRARFGWAIAAGVVLSVVNPSGVQTLLFPLGTPTAPLGVLNLALLVVAVAVMIAYRAFPNLRSADEAAAIASVFPVRAADALQAVGKPVRIFNYYDYGGYLLWRLYPHGSRIFIDG